MPKQLEEIKVFSHGIVSSPNPTDIPKEAATYSLNIDANEEQGALTAIKGDKLLTNDGWVNANQTEYIIKISK